jgi:hypothetical protein
MLEDIVVAGERYLVSGMVQVVHGAYRFVRLPCIAHELPVAILEPLENTFIFMMHVHIQTHALFSSKMLCTQDRVALTWRGMVAMQS